MLDTLAKHALRNHRNSIPILSQIRVRDGIATATDLDVAIYVPVDIKGDKMFYGHGFNTGVQVESDYPVTDFPDITIGSEEIGNVTMEGQDIAKLQWAMIAMSTEETRYYLNGIYFDKETIVATDGHRLHAVDKKINWGQNRKHISDDVIIPRYALKTIMSLIEETQAKKIEFKFYTEYSFTCQIGKIKVDAKRIDGHFPDWRRVVPEHPADKVSKFDPKWIAEIMPVVNVYNKIHGSFAPLLAIEKDKVELQFNHKAVKAWIMPFDLKIQIGFNAHYLEHMVGGDMTYDKAGDPVVFKGRDDYEGRLSVLMPMRCDKT